MRILQFRATGIAERDLNNDDRRTDRSSQPQSTHNWTTVLAKSTILMSTLTVALVVRSTTSHNNDVLEVMRLTGIDMLQARLAIYLAESANANGEVVVHEALDKAEVIKAAVATDPPDALAVKGVSVSAVGETTAAVISPVKAGVTLQATVSGTDKYYASYSLRTDSSGSVSFTIPPGAPGVVDTISVSAVLSGITTRKNFTWCAGKIPCSGH